MTRTEIEQSPYLQSINETLITHAAEFCTLPIFGPISARAAETGDWSDVNGYLSCLIQQLDHNEVDPDMLTPTVVLRVLGAFENDLQMMFSSESEEVQS